MDEKGCQAGILGFGMVELFAKALNALCATNVNPRSLDSVHVQCWDGRPHSLAAGLNAGEALSMSPQLLEAM